MTVGCKQCFKPVRSCHSQLLRDDIVSCAPCFLLESHRRFVWVRADQVREKVKSVVVCLFVLQGRGRTQCLTQNEQTLCLWLNFTRISFCCSWWLTPIVPVPEKLKSWDRRITTSSAHRMRPFSKAQSTFLSIGLISPAHMRCPFWSVLLRNTMWRILGQRETQ